MGTHLILDISRLLSRAARPVPTGIDRVEMAYARHFSETRPAALTFSAVTVAGTLGRISLPAGGDFIRALDAVWRGDGDKRAVARAFNRIRRELLWKGSLHAEIRRRGGDHVYLLASHHHLDRPNLFAGLKSQAGVRIACVVHDLIPITHPEFARAGQPERHARRMTTVAKYADTVIANSCASRDSAIAFFAKSGRVPPVAVAPLGIDTGTSQIAQSRRERPYFVCIGTIEPRKNHILLLNIWRDLVAGRGKEAPDLLIIGQRGWKNEAYVDMMERCAALRGNVVEFNASADGEVSRLLRGARALLMPSFVEGFGLPVAEALAAGVPVICSDLPALREVAGDSPDYLHPLDGPGWMRAILDFAQDGSAVRAAQISRLSGWAPPTWNNHFAIVQKAIDEAVA